MGEPLVGLLGEAGNEVHVTTRQERKPGEGIRYFTGNAREEGFLRGILEKGYDAVLDFMVYGSGEFRDRLPLFLENTDQYFFFSSARVYARSGEPLTEAAGCMQGQAVPGDG